MFEVLGPNNEVLFPWLLRLPGLLLVSKRPCDEGVYTSVLHVWYMCSTTWAFFKTALKWIIIFAYLPWLPFSLDFWFDMRCIRKILHFLIERPPFLGHWCLSTTLALHYFMLSSPFLMLFIITVYSFDFISALKLFYPFLLLLAFEL